MQNCYRISFGVITLVCLTLGCASTNRTETTTTADPEPEVQETQPKAQQVDEGGTQSDRAASQQRSRDTQALIDYISSEPDTEPEPQPNDRPGQQRIRTVDQPRSSLRR